MGLLTREPRADDEPALADAHAEAWRVGYGDLLEPAVLDTALASIRSGWPEWFADDGPRVTTLLALEVDGAVAGFIHFGPSDAGAEIHRLNLHPSAWGSGGADLLVGAALAVLTERGVPLVHLWTHAGAGRARRFYEQAGFVLSGREREEEVHGATLPVVEYTRPIA
ncbi:MAG: GNAT family N-acetyltransferase [Actinomycetota bacterium]|nr:GNAT family N-acetyltransferase [Acidimicrobiia bacterium]MDQ3293805.1 GNAT family N-acetyltransferase [Actinomycetota bacterium]